MRFERLGLPSLHKIKFLLSLLPGVGSRPFNQGLRLAFCILVAEVTLLPQRVHPPIVEYLPPGRLPHFKRAKIVHQALGDSKV